MVESLTPAPSVDWGRAQGEVVAPPPGLEGGFISREVVPTGMAEPRPLGSMTLSAGDSPPHGEAPVSGGPKPRGGSPRHTPRRVRRRMSRSQADWASVPPGPGDLAPGPGDRGESRGIPPGSPERAPAVGVGGGPILMAGAAPLPESVGDAGTELTATSARRTLRNMEPGTPGVEGGSPSAVLGGPQADVVVAPEGRSATPGPVEGRVTRMVRRFTRPPAGHSRPAGAGGGGQGARPGQVAALVHRVGCPRAPGARA